MKQEGRAIAKIKGGYYNGEYISLINRYNPKHGGIIDKYKKKQDRIYLDRGSALKGLEDDIKNQMTGVRKEIEIPNGKLQMLPNMETRDCLYISGPAGAGKSYFAGAYLKQLKKAYPKKQFFLFSNKEYDKSLDDLGVIRIPIDEALVDDPIEPKEMAYSCVIFDDISVHPNKKVLAAVETLRDQLLEVSRSDEVQVVSIVHNLTAGKSTKMSLLESTHVVFFPQAGDKYHVKRYLKEYAGLNHKQVNKVLNLDSRWVIHNKRSPNYFIHEGGVFFL